MKVIVARILNEPAVAIGFLIACALAVITARGAGGIDTEAEVLYILSPLATGLGIRQLVTPKQES